MLSLLAFAGSTGAQTTSTWNLAGDGNWSTPANWDTANSPNNGQPSPGDTYNAVLNTNRTITVDQDITIQGFTQSTGTVTGAAARTLTFNGNLAWTGGTMGGGMTVNANGGASVSNNVNHDLSDGTIFNNAGTMSWTQGSIGNSSNSWTFNNTSTGIINVNLASTPQAFGSLFGGTRSITNAGIINLNTSVAGNYLDFQSPITNTGEINISGSYAIMRGGSNSGTIDVAAGRTLQFSSSNFTQSGSGAINGAGKVQGVGGGTITFDSGTTYDVGATLAHSSDLVFNNTATTGTLELVNTGRIFGSGTLTATGLFTWTGNGGFPDYYGGIHGNMTVKAEGGMLMNGAAQKHVGNGSTVINSGSATWTSGDLVFKPTGGGSTTTFSNSLGGTLDLQFDGSIQVGGVASTNHFTNAGTFTKSGGAGTATFNTVSTNLSTGVIQINSGTFSVGSMANSGTITIGSGAVLTVNDSITTGGTYTQTAGGLILDGGTLNKSGSALSISGGSIGGTGTINANVSTTNATLSPGNSAGSLDITGDLAVTSGTIWNFELGGLLQGSGYDYLTEAGTSQLDIMNSSLQVSLINSFTPDALDTFTIFSSNQSILGAFGNLDMSGRVSFTEGSFLVSVTGSQIVLSDFQAVPEPGSLMIVGACALTGCFLRGRRSDIVRNA